MARHFGPLYPNLQIKQPLISSWLKDEAMWREQWEQSNHKSHRTAKQTRQMEHPKISEMMDLWVSKAMADGILLTGEILRQKWNVFADLDGVPEDERLKLSHGWLAHFKERNSLREMKRHGEAGTAKPENCGVRKETDSRPNSKRLDTSHATSIIWMKLGFSTGKCLQSLLSSPRPDLAYRMAPDKGLSDRRQAGVKGNKNRLTYVFTTNADGSDKLPAFIIGKAARPRAFQKKSGTQLGFYYRSNAKAWMTAQLYQEWIQQWDSELQVKKQKILLFQDNFSGHIVPPNLQNIRVENFEPNLTAHIQPLDQGIIRCFKRSLPSQVLPSRHQPL
jgi:hypothetical protein